jgi:hypothetical protein
LLLSLLPMVALIILGVVMDFRFSTNSVQSGVDVAAIIALFLLVIAAYFLMIAMIVRLSYDSRTGHPVRIGGYFASTLKSLIPIFLTSTVIWLCIVGIAFLVTVAGTMLGTSGIVLFTIAGLIAAVYLYVIWVAAIPSIVVEGQGLSSLSRSSSLTRGYRWPCFGAIIIMFACIMGLSMVLGIVQVAMAAMFGEIGAGIVSLLSSGLSMALTGVFIALIYARLREIKEGTSIETLADVFA